MDSSPLFLATSGPTKRRKHYCWLLFYQYCVCYFLNIVSNPKRNFPAKNRFRDYHAWNRIEKLVPLNCKKNQKSQKNSKKTTNSFSNLDFLVKSGFPKILDLAPAAPRGVYISRNETKQNIFSGNIGRPSKNVIC